MIGSPFGLDQTVTAGIVSVTGRANVGITEYEDFIRPDAAINPGNSGGNLGAGFAIPSDMASTMMTKLIDHGKVERGYLGALIQDLNQDLANSFGFQGTEEVLIGDVMEEWACGQERIEVR